MQLHHTAAKSLPIRHVCEGLEKMHPRGFQNPKVFLPVCAALMEAERRCCGDNSIVTYVNATFYPKQVADVTTGTATTAQSLYNPIPKCGGCCNS